METTMFDRGKYRMGVRVCAKDTKDEFIYIVIKDGDGNWVDIDIDIKNVPAFIDELIAVGTALTDYVQEKGMIKNVEKGD